MDERVDIRCKMQQGLDHMQALDNPHGPQYAGRAALRIAHNTRVPAQSESGAIKQQTINLIPQLRSMSPQMHQDMKPAKVKKTLKQCLESLPQELWNEIYDLTFSTPDLDPRTHVTGQRLKPWILFTANPPSTSVHISKHYKPPWQLQICRQMREEFSRAYYTSTFVGSVFDILAWVSSKQKSQRRLIKNIRCWVAEKALEVESMGTYFADYERAVILEDRLEKQGVSSAHVSDYRHKVPLAKMFRK